MLKAIALSLSSAWLPATSPGRGDNSKRINITETENKFSGPSYVFVFTLCQMLVGSNSGKEIGEMEVGGGHKEPGLSQQQFLLEIHVLDLVNVA